MEWLGFRSIKQLDILRSHRMNAVPGADAGIENLKWTRAIEGNHTVLRLGFRECSKSSAFDKKRQDFVPLAKSEPKCGLGKTEESLRTCLYT